MEPNANVAYNTGNETFEQIDTGSEEPRVTFSGTNMPKERPFSSSGVSRSSAGSTPSRTTRASGVKFTKDGLRNFFSYRVSTIVQYQIHIEIKYSSNAQGPGTVMQQCEYGVNRP